MKKQFPWFEIILIVVFMSIQIYAAFSDGYNFPNTWFSRDDAYYYFKVAQNISEGRGSTFDGIHPTNGYHPLWMLICVPIFALARFDLILPLRVMLIVMSGLTLVTAILLYHMLKEALSPPAGMLAAIYWVFSFYVQIVFYRQGLESGIALFFIVLLLYQLWRVENNWRKANPGLKQIAMLGVVAALATFGRLDLIFFCAVIGIWVIFRESPIRYLLPLDILALLVSALGAFIQRLGLPNYYSYLSEVTATLAVNLIIAIPTFYFFGLYQRPSGWSGLKILRRVAFASLVSGGLVSAFLLTAESFHLVSSSPIILLTNALLNFLSILVIRFAIYIVGNTTERTEYIYPVEFLKRNWTKWLTEGSTYYGVLGGALSIYMLWNKVAFGTFTPVSGEIKRWWASSPVNILGGQAGSIPAFLGLDFTSDFNAWQPLTGFVDQAYTFISINFKLANPTIVWHSLYPIILVLLCIAVYALFLIWRGKMIKNSIEIALIPLFVGSWLQILSYSTTGYSSPKEWYWLTEQIFLLFVMILAIDLLYKFLSKRWGGARAVMWAFTALYGIISIFQYGQDVSVRMPHGYSDLNRPYMDVIPFLEALTHPGDVIGMTGGGNVGYFIHDRTIVNMDGLINSYDYFEALKNGTSADYLYDTGMRFVFANPDIINSAPYRGQYNGRLQPIIDWGGKDLMRLLPKSAP